MAASSTIKRIMNSGVDNPGKIINPISKGKRGHPPLIPLVLIPHILNWRQEGGLKTFPQSKEVKALDISVNDNFILFDIDTPEDYEKLLKYYLDYRNITSHPK